MPAVRCAEHCAEKEFKLPWREAGPPNHHDDKVVPCAARNTASCLRQGSEHMRQGSEYTRQGSDRIYETGLRTCVERTVCVSRVVGVASVRFCAPPSRIRGLFRDHASDLRER